MNITCPECNTRFALAAGLVDADGKRLAKLFGEAEPALASAIWLYLPLFKPKKTMLTNARSFKLAAEVVALVSANVVQRDGDSRATLQSDWIEAMERMAANRPERLPLDGHGYLREVVMTVVIQREKTEKTDGYAERKVMDENLAKREASPLTARAANEDAEANKRAFESSIKAIGGQAWADYQAAMANLSKGANREK